MEGCVRSKGMDERMGGRFNSGMSRSIDVGMNEGLDKSMKG